MVDTVKGSRQVEQGQHCQVPAVQCQEYVSKIFDIDLWKCVNDDIVKSPSVSAFKKRLSEITRLHNMKTRTFVDVWW